MGMANSRLHLTSALIALHVGQAARQAAVSRQTLLQAKGTFAPRNPQIIGCSEREKRVEVEE